jgi:nucleoid-associated protein YgaU
MTRQTVAKTHQHVPTRSTLSSGGILQRKCNTCGQHTIAGGECQNCGKNKRSIQRKLAIGSSNDPLEREADRVAEQVLAMQTHNNINAAPPGIQRYTSQSAEEMNIAPTSVDHVLSSQGSPLEPLLQQDMEQRFGHDFSRVRVHTDEGAERSAREVNANAYTVGKNIVFGADQYSPGSHEGRRLIAHELTHVVQQGYGAAQSESSVFKVDQQNSTEKQEAHTAAHSISESKPAIIAATSMKQLNRKCSKPPTQVKHGKMSISMQEDDKTFKQKVEIVFIPDPNGPQTKTINLIQIAKTKFDSGRTWSSYHPDQAALEKFTIKTGFHADVRPELLKLPRRNKADPNISPAFPPEPGNDEPCKKVDDEQTGMSHTVCPDTTGKPGYNLPHGVHNARIIDNTGGDIGLFEFETVAHSDDLGINYGSVLWSFRSNPFAKPRYTDEQCQISATASSDFKESMIAFNKYYKNKHIVQAGETLKSISIDYFGDASRIARIYEINKQVLTDANPEAPIPTETKLEMPERTWMHLNPTHSTLKQNIWERAKNRAQR